VGRARHTLIFTVSSVSLELVIGLGMALAMHAAFRGQGSCAPPCSCPWAVLTVVTAVMWQDDVRVAVRLREHAPRHADGLAGLRAAGADRDHPGRRLEDGALHGAADTRRVAGDTREVYEAAEVDGASTWQRFVKITLPLLTPAILVALIFRTLDALRIFDLPYVPDPGAERHVDAVDDRAGDVRHNRIYGSARPWPC
jgi:multiple sugar transport system permease protein